MSCSEDRKNVRKFLEDLLEESEYQRVRRHVEACDACAQFVRAAGSVSSMLMELGRLNGPDDLPDAVVYRYAVKKRASVADTVPADAEPAPAPASVPAGSTTSPAAGSSRWIRAVVVLLALLVAGLAWRDWVQTRLLEALLQKNTASAEPKPAAVPPANPPGDFHWGNVRVSWPSANRESLLGLVRGHSGEVRYESPGWMAVRIPAARDAEWRSALAQVPEASIGGEVAASTASGDRLYSIDYGES